MAEVTVACVWQTGGVYDRQYVDRLRAGVERHSTRDVRFLCLSNSGDNLPGWDVYDTTESGLSGWWAKMLLLRPEVRGGLPLVYLDLDMVLLGCVDPLLDLRVRFGVCRNFLRRSLCRYGSTVMAFSPGWGDEEWSRWSAVAQEAMRSPEARLGDQYQLERILPRAEYLQDLLGDRFFVHKSDFRPHRPSGKIAVFSGAVKPHNTHYPWVREEWAA